MTIKKSAEKTPAKGDSDRFSCYLCGEDEVYSGIVFKGHCVCEDCVEYVCSSTLTKDGQIVFPLADAPSEEQPADSESVPTVSEAKK